MASSTSLFPPYLDLRFGPCGSGLTTLHVADEMNGRSVKMTELGCAATRGLAATLLPQPAP